MRNPRLKIVVTGSDGEAQFQIFHKGKVVGNSSAPYISKDAAQGDAEILAAQLQEAMMQAAPPPELTASLKKAKEKKPRKVKLEIKMIGKTIHTESNIPDVLKHLELAVTLISYTSIRVAGDNIDRLKKAMETIENVRKDLSEIE